MSQERRRYPRIDKSCIVDLEVMGGSDPRSVAVGSSTVNLSTVGLYIEADIECTKGDILKIGLNLGGRVIHIQAVVRWTDDTASGNLGVGAEFILLENISPEEFTRLISTPAK